MKSTNNPVLGKGFLNPKPKAESIKEKTKRWTFFSLHQKHTISKNEKIIASWEKNLSIYERKLFALTY